MLFRSGGRKPRDRKYSEKDLGTIPEIGGAQEVNTTFPLRGERVYHGIGGSDIAGLTDKVKESEQGNQSQKNE